MSGQTHFSWTSLSKAVKEYTANILYTVANRRHNGNGVLDEKRDGLVDENRVNNKENENNRAVFMLYLFAYNIKPMSK